MKLREALDTYMFDNVGQFGGIAESLGYQTEYRDGYFRFRKDVPMILNMSPSWRRMASASSGGRT